MGERTGVRVLSALAPAAMLAVDPWGWFPFGPVKWALVSTLALAAAALVLRTRPMRVPRLVVGALAVLLAWLSLAAALGAEPVYAWIGTPERRFGVLTWALCGLLLLVGLALDGERDARGVVTGTLVAGAGVGAVATLEALGWEPDVLDVGRRLTGTFGSSAYLGAATALLLPIALGVAVGSGPGRRRWAAAAASVLLAVACVGSGARAAWTGLAVAALVAAVEAIGPLVALVRAHPRRAAVLGLGSVVLAAGLLVLSPAGGRIGDTADAGSSGGRGRVDEWGVALDALQDHLALGLGPEGYRTVFDEHVDRDYAVAHGREVQPDRAHDGPLDLALAGGLPALAAWAVLVGCTARAAWAALRDGPAWRRGVAAGLVAHWVGQLFFFPVVELEPVAWLLAGLVLAARTPGDGRTLVGAGGNPGTLRTAVVGVLLVAAAAAVVNGVTEVVADHRADDAVDALARGDARAAVASAEDASDLRPDVVRLHLLAARTALVAERGYQAALGHVDDALEVSPDDPVAELARLTYLVGRAEATGTADHIDQAWRAVERRLAEDPYDPRLWDLAARAADLLGQEGAADEARREAEGLTPEDER